MGNKYRRLWQSQVGLHQFASGDQGHIVCLLLVSVAV